MQTNTPGTIGGPGVEKTLENQFFFVRKKNYNFFLHISSSYGKIFWETHFHTWEIPRSGSKAEDGEKKKERLNDGYNNGQAMHGARKHA